MAKLKKMLVAAIACAAIGLAATAHAQAVGAAGGSADATAGSASSAGTPASTVTGSTTGSISGMNAPGTNNNRTNNTLGLAGNPGTSGPAGTASVQSANALDNLAANAIAMNRTGTNLASNTANPMIAGGSLNANASTAANSLFPAPNRAGTATSQRSLTQTAMARVNSRENQITAQLNRSSAAGVGTGVSQTTTSSSTTPQ
jgi:hypothetical protein